MDEDHRYKYNMSWETCLRMNDILIKLNDITRPEIQVILLLIQLHKEVNPFLKGELREKGFQYVREIQENYGDLDDKTKTISFKSQIFNLMDEFEYFLRDQLLRLEILMTKDKYKSGIEEVEKRYQLTKDKNDTKS